MTTTGSVGTKRYILQLKLLFKELRLRQECGTYISHGSAIPCPNNHTQMHVLQPSTTVKQLLACIISKSYRKRDKQYFTNLTYKDDNLHTKYRFI